MFHHFSNNFRLSRFLFVFNLIITIGCFLVWLWLFRYLKNRASESFREIASNFPSRASRIPSRAISRRNSLRTNSLVMYNRILNRNFDRLILNFLQPNPPVKQAARHCLSLDLPTIWSCSSLGEEILLKYHLFT